MSKGRRNRAEPSVWLAPLPLFGVFAVVALAVYWPALSGPFVSDDLHYIRANPYVTSFRVENVVAILSPFSPATILVVNYAPVHLLAHAVEWQLFGPLTTGYHVVGVLVHAMASVLFSRVLVRSGVPALTAAGVAAVFLLHPANVEAVAWVSQLKTTLSLALSLGAILAWDRRPALATALFALALLTKATAVVVLPAALLVDWIRRREVRWVWMAGWVLLVAALLFAEFATHNRTGEAEPLSPDLLVRARTIVAFAGRYLWMASTSSGLSAFHEPSLAESPWDPVWLATLPVLAAVAIRASWSLRARREEAVYWAWAAVSFAPVSQVFPFLHPMADRYLYFILPGLLGAVTLVGVDVWRRIDADPVRSARLRLPALALLVGVCLVFASRSHARAEIWSLPERISIDAAIHYPDGRIAHVQRARRLARNGDPDAAMAELKAAAARGYRSYETLLRDADLRRLRDRADYRELIAQWTAPRIAWVNDLDDPTQIELRLLATAYIARRDFASAEAALERALAAKGPIDELIESELALVRRAQRDPSVELTP